MKIPENISEGIAKALAQVLEAERERVIKLAVAEFEQGLRKKLATTAVELSNYYSLERMGPNLIITVRVE